MSGELEKHLDNTIARLKTGGHLAIEEIMSTAQSDFAEAESRRSALAIHAKAVDRARDARARVIAHLHADLPAGSHLILAAIDAHARAQCWLREAAQAVCDICEFTDNGKAAGVIWETPLDVREAA